MRAKTDVSLAEVQARKDLTRRIDSTLEDSFPASDPPSWTAGVARLAPVGVARLAPAGSNVRGRTVAPSAAHS